MPDRDDATRFVFPRWANYVAPALLIGAVLGTPYVIVLVGFGLSPVTLNANYQPEQPIPYSHELHVSRLGMDCRYCHTTVEDASFAAIPATSICMNCHHAIRPNSPKLTALYESFRTGMPVRWRKVHDLEDYAYFDHSAHVNKGVSCVSCHGRVDRMGEDGVYVRQPLSMGWCLKCHRDPAPNLRPVDQVTNLLWGQNLTQADIEQLAQLDIEGLDAASLTPGGPLNGDQQRLIGQTMHQRLGIKSVRQMQECSACHR